MDSCCARTAERLAVKQGKVLRVILWLNLGMFVVEATAGVLARSSALLGDSLDMLGDALAYGATLLVLRRSLTWKSRASIFKGALMTLTAVGVLVAALFRASAGELPTSEAMGGVGLAALVVNAACLYLLSRHRSDDLNMSSAWTCSRNDLIANSAVIAAAGAVAVTGSLWPDFIVGVGIAGLFFASGFSVLRAALAQKTKAAEASVLRAPVP
jgi:Co/Zn/Cd efflux system component